MFVAGETMLVQVVGMRRTPFLRDDMRATRLTGVREICNSDFPKKVVMNRYLMMLITLTGLWLAPQLAYGAWSYALAGNGVSPAAAVKTQKAATKSSIARRALTPKIGSRSLAPRKSVHRRFYRTRAWHYPKTDSRRFGGRSRR